MLFFHKDADETIALPPNQIKYMHLEGATALAIYFIGDNGVEGSLNLTITSGTARKVMEVISSAAARDFGLITVADDTNSVYLHPGITAVAAVTISD